MLSQTRELESGTSHPGATPLSVKGRPKAHSEFWERINAPPFITEIPGGIPGGILERDPRWVPRWDPG